MHECEYRFWKDKPFYKIVTTAIILIKCFVIHYTIGLIKIFSNQIKYEIRNAVKYVQWNHSYY